MEQKSKPKLLILYAEVMGYTLSTLELIETSGVDLYVVHWDNKKISSYKIKTNKKIKFLNYSSFSTIGLIKFIKELNPDLTVISGWNDFKYLFSAFFLRSKGKKVICGMDNQWKGTFKQRLASFFSNRSILKILFSHVWIVGVEQYEYVRKLGFRSSDIIWDAHCADLKNFNSQNITRSFSGKKKLIFVGRLEKEKGIDKLLATWDSIHKKNNWELEIIGEGSLKFLLDKYKNNISYTPFLQPEDLVKKLKESHALILPSIFEPWGVILQEAAACGLPIIASNEVGSATKFLINNFNGYRFLSSKKDQSNLKKVLEKLINMSDVNLECFSKRSLTLSNKIETFSAVANLLSLLN